MGDTKKPEPAPALPDGWEWGADGIARAETITPGGVVRRVRVDRDGDVEVDTYAPARVVLAVLARAGYGGGESGGLPHDALQAIAELVDRCETPDQCLVCHELLDKPENDNGDGELLGHTHCCPVAALKEMAAEVKPPALPADLANWCAYGDEPQGWYAVGHHDPATFLAACKRTDDWEMSDCEDNGPEHVYYRRVFIVPGTESFDFKAAPLGEGVEITVLDFTGGQQMNPKPPALPADVVACLKLAHDGIDRLMGDTDVDGVDSVEMRGAKEIMRILGKYGQEGGGS